ncbi:MAG: hypothetical protein OEZ39_11920 [Gammaproteobacteria bacterium]|nr:hypothetical protein [Gammaproteobacteria bacterium]MDH5652550.1 hypothetical protein [Gammaproteobacteria bacterium]
MPLDDIGEGLVKAIFRFIWFVLIDIGLDILIKGPGYLLLMYRYRNSDEEPGEVSCILIGIVFWLIVATLAYSYFQFCCPATS